MSYEAFKTGIFLVRLVFNENYYRFFSEVTYTGYIIVAGLFLQNSKKIQTDILIEYQSVFSHFIY